MAKTNPETYNPNVVPPNFVMQARDYSYNLGCVLNHKPEYFDANENILLQMGRLKSAVDKAEANFMEKYNTALEMIRNADEKGLIAKMYTYTPLIPKLEYQIHQEVKKGWGLNTPNKLGGLPDLRKHWLMGENYRKNKSVKDVLKRIWPKHPNGGFLSCMGTIDMDIYMYLLNQTTSKDSAFSWKDHDYNICNGNLAFFAPWMPQFDSRMDACVIKLENDTHGITEEEYMDAVDSLKILDIEKEYHNDENTSPDCYYEVSNPIFGFDLDLYSENIESNNKNKWNLYDVKDAVVENEFPNNPFNSQYPALCFGGEPTTQQTPRRYMDVNSYPTPHRMTPFVGFSHPVADMNYQIYTGKFVEMEDHYTHYGKVDSSCT